MNKRTVTLYPSAARTATPDAIILNSGRSAAVYMVVEVTAAPSSPSVVFTIDLWDSASGTAVNLLTSAAVASVSSNIYKISPALTESSSLVSTEHVPENIRIKATHGNTDSITYSVSVHLI